MPGASDIGDLRLRVLQNGLSHVTMRRFVSLGLMVRSMNFDLKVAPQVSPFNNLQTEID